MIALAALGWVMSDSDRAQRFLDLTGLSPDALRSAIGESETHRAVLDFLCGHEPDLLAASEALGMKPLVLTLARDRLDG